jgi:hypothetical protein
LVERQDGRGLIAVGHADQRGLGGGGHKAHGHKNATTDAGDETLELPLAQVHKRTPSVGPTRQRLG